MRLIGNKTHSQELDIGRSVPLSQLSQPTLNIIIRNSKILEIITRLGAPQSRSLQQHHSNRKRIRFMLVMLDGVFIILQALQFVWRKESEIGFS